MFRNLWTKQMLRHLSRSKTLRILRSEKSREEDYWKLLKVMRRTETRKSMETRMHHGRTIMSKELFLDVISLFKPAWSHLLTSKRLHHQTTTRINAGSCVQEISSKFNYFYKLGRARLPKYWTILYWLNLLIVNQCRIANQYLINQQLMKITIDDQSIKLQI